MGGLSLDPTDSYAHEKHITVEYGLESFKKEFQHLAKTAESLVLISTQSIPQKYIDYGDLILRRVLRWVYCWLMLPRSFDFYEWI